MEIVCRSDGDWRLFCKRYIRLSLKTKNKHKTITNVFRHVCMYACMNSGSMSKGEIHRQTAAKQAAYTHIREREKGRKCTTKVDNAGESEREVVGLLRESEMP